MSRTRDDKSVQEAYYKTLTSQNLVSHDGHTNLSDPNVAPVLYPELVSEGDATSIQAAKKTSCKSHTTLRIPPRRIALCGGGVRAVAHVGVMKAFQENGILSHIKEVIGISAGSFFALLWVLEYSISQIEHLSLDFDFTLLRNIEPESIFLFPITFGIDNGQGIEKLINSILKQKGFSPDVTFEQILEKHPLHLRCFATELQTSKVREFSTLKTPKSSVKLAIRASMTLPFFYTPVKEIGSDALLVDGGLLNNLPLAFLKEHEIRETWGVLFTTQQRETIEPVHDIMDVIRYIYDSSTIMKSLPYIEKYKDNLICIPTGEFSAIHFEQTRQEKIDIIKKAYTITRKFVFSLPKHSLKRRFSAC